MARKKAAPVEEQDTGMETFGLPESEASEGMNASLEDSVPAEGEGAEIPPVPVGDGEGEPPGDPPEAPPGEDGVNGSVMETPEEQPLGESLPEETPPVLPDSPETVVSPESVESLETAPTDMADFPVESLEGPAESVPDEGSSVPPETPTPRPKSDRQSL